MQGAVRLRVRYPGGGEFDAETMFVDPHNADVYIVTKSTSGASRVFRYPAPHNASVITTLTEVARYQFPSTENVRTTGGDMSPDGSFIIVRTYNRVYGWPRPNGTSVGAAFTRTACSYDIITEAQGEAAGFHANGRDLVLTTEGGSPPIYHYARR